LNTTNLPFQDPASIRKTLVRTRGKDLESNEDIDYLSLQDICEQAGNLGIHGGAALISAIQARSMLVDEINEKSKQWDHRFRSTKDKDLDLGTIHCAFERGKTIREAFQDNIVSGLMFCAKCPCFRFCSIHQD
jgi:hypothetical protein